MKYYNEDGHLFGMEDDDKTRYEIPDADYHYDFQEDVPDPKFGEDAFEVHMAKLHNMGLYKLENFYRDMLCRPAAEFDPDYLSIMQRMGSRRSAKLPTTHYPGSTRLSGKDTQQIIAEIFNCPLDMVDDFVRVTLARTPTGR